MNKAFAGILLIGILDRSPLHAQVSPQDLIDNIAFLRVTTAVNKPEYFPGEEMTVTVTVENPTARALTVPKLFIPETGGLRKFRVTADGGLELGQLESPVPGTDVSSPPTDTLAPGEQRIWAAKLPEVEGALAPLDAGRYSIAYTYTGAEDRFRVVIPQVEQIAEARLAANLELPADDTVPAMTVPVYRRVFSLRRAGVSSVCVLLSKTEIITKDGGTLADYLGQMIVGQFSPMRRLAESPLQIVNLTATADPQDNLTIVYRDGNGGEHRLDLDANLNPR